MVEASERRGATAEASISSPPESLLSHDRTSSSSHAQMPPSDRRHAVRQRLGRRRNAAIALTVSGVLAAPIAIATTADADARPTTSASTGSHVVSASAAPKLSSKPRFHGHRPGRIYLGMSCGELCHQKEPQLGRNFGLQRWYKKWGNWHGVAEAIQEDRRKNRLPWISIEGPAHGSPTGWRDTGRGRYDSDIRALAKVLKANDRGPIFISFDHEPSNKALDSQGSWWAHGYNHFYDVLKRARALKHVAVPPIMADWMFNKYNHEDNPSSWLLPGVLRRAPFLAVDVYQNDSGKTYGSRLPRIARWLGRHGHPRMMLGIGETASTNFYRNTTAVSWLNRSFRWAAHHPGRVAAISYFNSTAFSRDGAYWPLDESSRKLNTYRKWLSKPVFIKRVG
jgi:hypothetical protein